MIDVYRENALFLDYSSQSLTPCGRRLANLRPLVLSAISQGPFLPVGVPIHPFLSFRINFLPCSNKVLHLIGQSNRLVVLLLFDEIQDFFF